MHKENDGLIIFLLSKGKSGFTSNTFLIPQQDLFMAYIRHGFGRCLIEVLRTYLQDLDGELSTYNERELDIHYAANILLKTITQIHKLYWNLEPYSESNLAQFLFFILLVRYYKMIASESKK